MTHSTLSIAGGKSQQFTTLKIDTVFNFYKPEPPLSKFIDNFWLYEGGESEQKVERILPTGTLELAINLRHNELSFFDAAQPANRSRHSGAVVSGAHGHSFAPGDEKEVFIIGVHFKPGGAFPFLGVPADDLTDVHADLSALWGSSAGRLRERLCEVSTAAERFHLLQQALLSRLRSGAPEQHYAVSAALEMFGKNQAGTTVREAAKYLGLSQRRFIQVFKTEVGLTPKLFSRIQRFQQTRTFIGQNPAPDWTSLALDLGYCDQSHFIREFLEFSGLRPTEYLIRHRLPKPAINDKNEHPLNQVNFIQYKCRDRRHNIQ
ncbi:MAG TPA: helix-turn-helix domain-containing protein, partial [Pyrinomonadaceae bacterium]|nr:helix-turn-helix domain-containing protein [Pyrinomonadaceae bacterium]